jgi:hypothetical protein
LEELQAYIRTDKSISEMVRKQALDWAELFWGREQGPAPLDLNGQPNYTDASKSTSFK